MKKQPVRAYAMCTSSPAVVLCVQESNLERLSTLLSSSGGGDTTTRKVGHVTAPQQPSPGRISLSQVNDQLTLSDPSGAVCAGSSGTSTAGGHEALSATNPLFAEQQDPAKARRRSVETLSMEAALFAAAAGEAADGTPRADAARTSHTTPVPLTMRTEHSVPGHVPLSLRRNALFDDDEGSCASSPGAMDNGNGPLASVRRATLFSDGDKGSHASSRGAGNGLGGSPPSVFATPAAHLPYGSPTQSLPTPPSLGPAFSTPMGELMGYGDSPASVTHVPVTFGADTAQSEYVARLEEQVRTLQQQLQEYSALVNMVGSRRSTRDTPATTPREPTPAGFALGTSQSITGANTTSRFMAERVGTPGARTPRDGGVGSVGQVPAGLEHVSEPSRQMVLMLQARLDAAQHELSDREQQIQQLAAQVSQSKPGVRKVMSVVGTPAPSSPGTKVQTPRAGLQDAPVASGVCVGLEGHEFLSLDTDEEDDQEVLNVPDSLAKQYLEAAGLPTDLGSDSPMQTPVRDRAAHEEEAVRQSLPLQFLGAQASQGNDIGLDNTEALQARVAKLTREVEEGRHELESARRESEDLRDEYFRLQDQHIQLQADRDALQDSLAQLQSKQAELQAAAARQQDTQGAAAAVSHLEAAASQLEAATELAELQREQLASLRSLLVEREGELQTLRETVATYQERLQRQQALADTTEQEKLALLHQVDELESVQQQLVASQAEVTALTARLHERESQLHSLDHAANESAQRALRLSAHVRELEQTFTVTDSALDASDLAVKELHDLLHRRENALAQVRAQLAQRDAELSQSQAALAVAEARLAQLEEPKGAPETREEDVLSSQQHAEVASLKQQLEEQARELEGLRQQQTVKAAALELAAEEMATQQDGLSDLTQQCAATQVQLAGLREQVANREAQLAALREQIAAHQDPSLAPDTTMATTPAPLLPQGPTSLPAPLFSTTDTLHGTHSRVASDVSATVAEATIVTPRSTRARSANGAIADATATPVPVVSPVGDGIWVLKGKRLGGSMSGAVGDDGELRSPTKRLMIQLDTARQECELHKVLLKETVAARQQDAERHAAEMETLHETLDRLQRQQEAQSLAARVVNGARNGTDDGSRTPKTPGGQPPSTPTQPPTTPMPVPATPGAAAVVELRSVIDELQNDKHQLESDLQRIRVERDELQSQLADARLLQAQYDQLQSEHERLQQRLEDAVIEQAQRSPLPAARTRSVFSATTPRGDDAASPSPVRLLMTLPRAAGRVVSAPPPATAGPAVSRRETRCSSPGSVRTRRTASTTIERQHILEGLKFLQRNNTELCEQVDTLRKQLRDQEVERDMEKARMQALLEVKEAALKAARGLVSTSPLTLATAGVRQPPSASRAAAAAAAGAGVAAAGAAQESQQPLTSTFTLPDVSVQHETAPLRAPSFDDLPEQPHVLQPAPADSAAGSVGVGGSQSRGASQGAQHKHSVSQLEDDLLHSKASAEMQLGLLANTNAKLIVQVEALLADLDWNEREVALLTATNGELEATVMSLQQRLAAAERGATAPRDSSGGATPPHSRTPRSEYGGSEDADLLRGQVAALQEQLDTSQHNLRDVRDALAEAQRQVLQLSAELQGAVESQQAAEARMGELEQEAAAAYGRAREAEELASVAGQSVEELSAQLAEFEERLAASIMRGAAQEERLRAAADAAAASSAEARAAAGRAEESEAAADSLRAQLAAETAARQAAEDEAATLGVQLAAACAAVEAATAGLLSSEGGARSAPNSLRGDNTRAIINDEGEVGCVSQARESEVAVASVDETNLLRECVSELERALQLAQSRLDTAERQVQDLQAEVASHAAKADAASQEASQLRDEIASLSSHADALAEAKADVEWSLSCEQQRLHDSQQLAAQLEAELAASREAAAAEQEAAAEQLRLAEAQLADEQRQLAAAQDELQAVRADLRAAEDQLRQSQEETYALATQLQDAGTASAALVGAQTALDAARVEIDARSAQLDAVKLELEGTQLQLQAAAEQMAAAVEERAEHESRVLAAAEEAAALRSQLQQAEAAHSDELAGLDSQLRDAQEAAEGYRECADQLQSELVSLQGHLQEARDAVTEQVAELQQQLQDALAAAEEHRARAGQLQGELNALRVSSEERLRAELERQEGKWQEQVTELMKGTTQMSAALATTQSHITELQAAVEELPQLRSQLADSHSQQLQLQSTIQALQQQSATQDAAAQDVEVLRAKLAEGEVREQELHGAVRELEAMYGELQAATQELRVQLDASQSREHTLQEQLSEYQAKVEALRVDAAQQDRWVAELESLREQIEALDEERREALQANEAAQQAVSEHAEARRAAETDLQNALRDLNLHRQVSELAADKVRRLEGDLLLAHEQVERFDKALSVLRRDLLQSAGPGSGVALTQAGSAASSAEQASKDGQQQVPVRVGEELMQLKAAAEAGAALCESLTKQVDNLTVQVTAQAAALEEARKTRNQLEDDLRRSMMATSSTQALPPSPGPAPQRPHTAAPDLAPEPAPASRAEPVTATPAFVPAPPPGPRPHTTATLSVRLARPRTTPAAAAKPASSRASRDRTSGAASPTRSLRRSVLRSGGRSLLLRSPRLLARYGAGGSRRTSSPRAAARYNSQEADSSAGPTGAASTGPGPSTNCGTHGGINGGAGTVVSQATGPIHSAWAVPESLGSNKPTRSRAAGPRASQNTQGGLPAANYEVLANQLAHLKDEAAARSRRIQELEAIAAAQAQLTAQAAAAAGGTAGGELPVPEFTPGKRQEMSDLQQELNTIVSRLQMIRDEGLGHLRGGEAASVGSHTTTAAAPAPNEPTRRRRTVDATSQPPQLQPQLQEGFGSNTPQLDAAGDGGVPAVQAKVYKSGTAAPAPSTASSAAFPRASGLLRGSIMERSAQPRGYAQQARVSHARVSHQHPLLLTPDATPAASYAQGMLGRLNAENLASPLTLDQPLRHMALDHDSPQRDTHATHRPAQRAPFPTARHASSPGARRREDHATPAGARIRGVGVDRASDGVFGHPSARGPQSPWDPLGYLPDLPALSPSTGDDNEHMPADGGGSPVRSPPWRPPGLSPVRARQPAAAAMPPYPSTAQALAAMSPQRMGPAARSMDTWGAQNTEPLLASPTAHAVMHGEFAVGEYESNGTGLHGFERPSSRERQTNRVGTRALNGSLGGGGYMPRAIDSVLPSNLIKALAYPAARTLASGSNNTRGGRNGARPGSSGFVSIHGNQHGLDASGRQSRGAERALASVLAARTMGGVGGMNGSGRRGGRGGRSGHMTSTRNRQTQ